MDSGNSGSLQSSSGGSEEYDSRAASDSISALLNNNPSSIPNQRPPQPPPHHQTHSSPSVYDTLYFDPLSKSPQISANPNSLLNLDMAWSKGLRSESNCNDLGGFMAATQPTQQLLVTQQGQNRGGGGGAVFSSVHIPHGVPEKGTASGSVSGTCDQVTNTNINSNQNMVRNPKKRSRASRRAPTTVLTTDTTNFRAMVQEFTGIPAPPFTSSPFPRSRLDLFGTASSMRSTTHLDPSTPHYLLRPFAQKIQPPPFSSSTSSVDAMAATTSANNNGTPSSTSINYQLPSELGLLKQPQNLLQNPVLNFQSLLQPPQKYPLPNSAILGTKLQGSLDIPSNDPSLKMGVFEEFGLSHSHGGTTLGGLQNMVSSVDGALPRRDNSNNPPNWGDGGAGSHENQGLLKSINGNGKLNFSGSTSDFHGSKGPENVAARSEGMVESWICSSD